MKTVIRRQLSIESIAHLDVAVALSLSQDEELYAANINNGIPVTDEHLQQLLQSIGGQRLLLQVIRACVGVDVLLEVES